MNILARFRNPYIRITVIFIIVKVLVALIMLGLSGWNVNKAFYHWDGVWYRDIVDNGYDTSYASQTPTDPYCTVREANCLRNFAFFPVYPILIKGFVLVGIDSLYAGLIVSNVCNLLAIFLLYRLALEFWKDQTKAYISALSMLVFPAAFIFGVYMTESVFICTFLLAYLLAYKKKWIYAGLAGLVLSATRNTGILFMICMVLLWLEQNNYNYKNIFKDRKFLIGLLLVPIGLLLFMTYLYFHVGDPIAFINIQAYWGKALVPGGPIGAMLFALYDWHLETNILNHLYNLSYLVLTVGLFSINIKKKWLPNSMSFILLWLVVPLTSGSTVSFSRYASVLFPIYLLVPILYSKHRRIFYVVLAISSCIAFAFCMFYPLRLTITS